MLGRGSILIGLQGIFTASVYVPSQILVTVCQMLSASSVWCDSLGFRQIELGPHPVSMLVGCVSSGKLLVIS